MKNTNIKNFIRSQKGLSVVLVLIAILIVVLIGIVAYKLTPNKGSNKTPAGATYQVVKRSKELGYIIKVTTAKSVDPKTNKPINPTINFATADNPIYLVCDLNNPPVGTRIDYIRYLNGRYIDHRSVLINQPGTKAVVFDWATSAIGTHRPTGAYRVKLYANGILEKRANYNVGNLSAFELYLDNLFNLFI